MSAAARLIEGVHLAAVGADQDGAADEGGLGAGAIGARKADRHARFEIGQLFRRQPRRGCGDVAGIGWLQAPVDHIGRRAEVRRWHVVCAGRQVGGGHGAHGDPGQELGDVHAFIRCQPRGLHLHDALFHGPQDGLRGHQPDHVPMRGLLHRAFMAARASRLVDGPARHRLPSPHQVQIGLGRVVLVPVGSGNVRRAFHRLPGGCVTRIAAAEQQRTEEHRCQRADPRWETVHVFGALSSRVGLDWMAGQETARARDCGTSMCLARRYSPSDLACLSMRWLDAAPVPSTPRMWKFRARRLGSS